LPYFGPFKYFRLEHLQADVILLDMDHPHRDIIESCVSSYDLPTVLFTKNSDKDTIKQAIDAGVTAYIVDGIDPARLHTILEISIEQYKKHKKLEGDLKLKPNWLIVKMLKRPKCYSCNSHT
jgi:response regulator NasT